MGIYISSIGTANPKNRYKQSELVEFMSKIHKLNAEESRRLKVLYRATGIDTRYSVLPDFQMNGHYELFKVKEPNAPHPGTLARMASYRKEAFNLSKEAIDNCENTDLSKVTHLITVSCTGFYAPGLDYDILRAFNLSKDVERYSINFMGCFAAINALKAAWNICKGNQDASVLVVCVELCSIHLQSAITEDNLLANSLFGDGAAAVIINGKKPEKPSLKLNSFFSSILPDGENDMAWEITDFGFQMKLSEYVPEVIKNGIHKLSNEVFSRVEKSSFKHFLLHPGGKKILEVVEDHFGLTRHDNRYAYDVLRQFGNMSSPTILFVIKRFLDELSSNEAGEQTLALAFGPGLTIESAIMETV